MDNQQERLVELSFVAGVIVGEGCFTLAVNAQDKPRGHVNPIFSFFMTDKDTVEIVYAILHRHNLPGYFETRRKQPPFREQYGVRVGGVKSMERFCRELLPFLTGEKHKAASVVHRFCERRLLLGRGGPFGPEDIEMIGELRKINSSGSGGERHKFPLDQLPRILRDYTPCPSV